VGGSDDASREEQTRVVCVPCIACKCEARQDKARWNGSARPVLELWVDR
jgi:hypothetical protein